MRAVDLRPRHPSLRRGALWHRAPLFELACWLLLWPVWWILGIEQFVPTIASVLLVVRMALAGQLSLSRHRALVIAFVIFLLAQLLSLFGIDSMRRLLTFGRSWATWISALAILVLAVALPRDLDDLHKLLWILAGLVAIAAIGAITALLGFRPEGWTPPFARLLPESLERGGYLEQLVERSLGRQAFFRPLGYYYRVSGLFLWPLGNATALVAALPLVATLTQRGKPWHRAAAWVIVVLGLVNLLFTTGRAAMAGLVVGGLVAWACYSRFRRLFWKLALVALALLLVLVLADLATPGQSFLWQNGSRLLSEIVFARDQWKNTGSATGRLAVVLQTLQGWMQRPVLGWGTARAVPDAPLPAGTHSTYLGLLYKHGLVGLGAYLALLALLWHRTCPLGRAAAQPAPWAQNLLVAGRWSLVAVLVDGITSTPASDTMTLVIIWLGFGILLACRGLLDPDAACPNRERQSAWVLGVRVASLSMEELTHRVVRLAQERAHALILNVNVHCLNLAYRLPWLRDTLNGAELVFCDGAGVVLGARLLGQRIRRRITYAEWMWHLAAAASQADLSIAFVGARPGVAARAADRLCERYPNLRAQALHNGYFDKGDDSSENTAVIASINALRPDILVIGFGMPLQEQWLKANWHRIDAGVALTGGGVFDYVSGSRRRAPEWMTQHSLEWLGRLLIEPRRLWRRYLIGNPLFLWRVLKQRVGIDRWPPLA